MAAALIIYDDPWSIIQHCTFLNISIYIYILSSGSVCQRVQQPLVTFRCVLCAWSMTSAACGFAHTDQFANHLSKQLVKTSKQKSHEHHEQPVFHPASSYVRVVPLPLAYKKATERGKESKHEQTWEEDLAKKIIDLQVCRWSPITPSRNTRISHGSRL